MRALIFEHDAADLAPLTGLRPACGVRTGALTLAERAAQRFDVIGLARPGHEGPPVCGAVGLRLNPRIDAGPLILLNGRTTAIPDAALNLGVGDALVEPGGAVVAAHLEADAAASFLASRELGSAARLGAESCLLHKPWDVIRHRDAALRQDLATLGGFGPTGNPQGGRPVAIHPSASIAPTAVLDASAGPIVIAEGASVGALAVVCGPAYLGPRSSVLPQALIKANTAIGPMCKAAGEIGGTIFQGFANKAHDGHLGDSWVGEWVNLGAGTTNSNLLNTYAPVKARADPGARLEDTGLQFLGALLGDHAKTAICTRLMTGSVIGVGCMIATTAPPPTTLAPFTWLTDERQQIYRFTKFMDVARAVMARRGVEPSDHYTAALETLHGAASTR